MAEVNDSQWWKLYRRAKDLHAAAEEYLALVAVLVKHRTGEMAINNEEEEVAIWHSDALRLLGKVARRG